jgi:hypothetical protein
MAYVSQDTKKELVKAVKEELKRVLGDDVLKVTFSVRNHSTIVATITEGSIDFGTTECQVNHYYISSNFSGKACKVLEAIYAGLLEKHWDHSDIQADYFNCAYYININIGRWDKPYRKVNAR